MEACRELILRLSPFAANEIQEEAERQGIAPEELVVHAIAYYLADRDTGRIAHAAPSLGSPRFPRKAGGTNGPDQ